MRRSPQRQSARKTSRTARLSVEVLEPRILLNADSNRLLAGIDPQALVSGYYRDLLQRSPDCAGLALQILRLYWETSVDGPKPHSLTW